MPGLGKFDVGCCCLPPVAECPTCLTGTMSRQVLLEFSGVATRTPTGFETGHCADCLDLNDTAFLADALSPPPAVDEPACLHFALNLACDLWIKSGVGWNLGGIHDPTSYPLATGGLLGVYWNNASYTGTLVGEAWSDRDPDEATYTPPRDCTTRAPFTLAMHDYSTVGFGVRRACEWDAATVTITQVPA